MATGFGRKGTVDEDLAARRAAFIASERARAAGRPSEDASHRSAPVQTRASAATRSPGYGADTKSLPIAYLLWFFLGGFSAHRFYLGYSTSAGAQVGLSMGSLVVLLVGTVSLSPGMLLFGFAGMVAAGLWILADAFMIPGMLERANRTVGPRHTSSIFA